jgi:tetratricopeptide (TPR) repeat protein
MRNHTRLLVLVCAVFAAQAFAEPAVRAQNAAETKRARQLFKQGLTLYRLHEFKVALKRFEAALKLKTRASIVLNIAQCHRKLNNAQKALFYYKLYLSRWAEQFPNRRSPYQVEVDKQIKALGARLLREADGALKIFSEPPGAEIWIDGRVRPGKTPAVLQKLAKGEHGLELRKGDLRYRGRVEVVGGTQTEVRVVLARVLGALELTSSPAGAEIRLGDKVVGKTPHKLIGLTLGQHTLELRRAGHVPARRLVLIDGPELQRIALSLPRLATLAVRSTPAGATVILDGKAVGQAPVRLEVEPGKHTVSLKAPGRQALAREINAAAGATVQLDEALVLNRVVQLQIDTRRSKRIWAWSTLSVGIAGALTSLALIAVGISWDSNGSRYYEEQTVQRAMDEQYDEMVAGRRLITGGIVAGSVAVAALAVSIFQFVTAPAAPDAALRLGVGPTQEGGAALQIGGVY